MKALVEKIEERSPQILSEYRANLEEKVRELLADTQIEGKPYRRGGCDFCGQDLYR